MISLRNLSTKLYLKSLSESKGPNDKRMGKKKTKPLPVIKNISAARYSFTFEGDQCFRWAGIPCRCLAFVNFVNMNSSWSITSK